MEFNQPIQYLIISLIASSKQYTFQVQETTIHNTMILGDIQSRFLNFYYEECYNRVQRGSPTTACDSFIVVQISLSSTTLFLLHFSNKPLKKSQVCVFWILLFQHNI